MLKPKFETFKRVGTVAQKSLLQKWGKSLEHECKFAHLKLPIQEIIVDYIKI